MQGQRAHPFFDEGDLTSSGGSIKGTGRPRSGSMYSLGEKKGGLS